MTSALLHGTMNSKDAASYLGVSEATMKRWRQTSSGPEYIRLGERSIKYRKSDLDKYILDRRVHAK
jgi:predicted DNA-binding transcriptional regulator AlpA